MGEFSEPEDLMEGIHVSVEEQAEHYDHPLLPHLTIENGYAHQDNARHWSVFFGLYELLLAVSTAMPWCKKIPYVLCDHNLSLFQISSHDPFNHD